MARRRRVGPGGAHAPTTVFTSSSEDEEKEEERPKEEPGEEEVKEEGDTSDWLSEESEGSDDPADPNGVAASFRKDAHARERGRAAASTDGSEGQGQSRDCGRQLCGV